MGCNFQISRFTLGLSLLIAGTSGLAVAQTEDQTEDPERPNEVGVEALAQITSQQIQGQRAYDEISGRIFDRVASFEIGDVAPPAPKVKNASDAGVYHYKGLGAAGEKGPMNIGAWMAGTYDKAKFDNDEGVDHDIEMTNVYFGVDALFSEKFLIGASVNVLDYEDNGTVSDIAEFDYPYLYSEPGIFDGVGLRYTETGKYEEDFTGLGGSAYAAYVLSNGFGKSGLFKNSFFDGYVSYSQQSSESTKTADVVDIYSIYTYNDNGNILSETDYFTDEYSFVETGEFDQKYWDIGVNFTLLKSNKKNNFLQSLTVGYQRVVVEQSGRSKTKTITESDGSVYEPNPTTAEDGDEPFGSVRLNYRANFKVNQTLSWYGKFNYQYLDSNLATATTAYDHLYDLDPNATITPEGQRRYEKLNQQWSSVELGGTVTFANKLRLRASGTAQVSPIERYGFLLSLQVPFGRTD